jgi:phosphoribosylformylglycinamidine synthase subunit PurSL
MTLPVHSFIVGTRLAADPTAAGLLADAHALGVTRLEHIGCFTLYFIEGHVTAPELDRLAAELFGDPVAQTSVRRSSVDGVVSFNGNGTRNVHVIETALRPGVTDPVADQIARSARLLGITGVERAATGRRYLLTGPLNRADIDFLAQRLLANPVIHHYVVGAIQPSFPGAAAASDEVERLPLRELDAQALQALSTNRRAALDLPEMQAIQAYFRAEGRDPTDVEFETIAQTWSEHCVHKTFKALIEVRSQKSEVGTVPAELGTEASDFEINGLLRTYLRAATEKINAPWVRSAFVDNAGIIDFDDEYEISFKVETHNHPSAIEPFGGANTGVGGVIRDVLGVSARPIAATDVLCFGPQSAHAPGVPLPEGVLPPRLIRSGVVAGVRDYGNKIGLPTVNGAIWYDPGYTANPLVFCGCVGLAPKGRHPRSPQVGDRLIVLGGRTGRDGLRGATFSSMTMDAQTGTVAGASVQIGDPIVEKGLIEVITQARDEGLYHAITDCGAGGLSSAVGEMASGLGADIDLATVRLKYPGLAPWEIWLSEAQERMVLAVAPDRVAALQAIADTFDVELTDIGCFSGTGRLCVHHGERLVLDLANAFLHDGLPQRRLCAELPVVAAATTSSKISGDIDLGGVLLRLLSHPNIATKADVIRSYDHEVQGGTVVKPLTGLCNDGPSDACVLKPLGTAGRRGIVISNGINPEYGQRDPYNMALSVVDEAIRNAVAVGADPDRIALLDNFCWGDPRRPDTLGALVAAARGCHDAALHYGTPFISGKDSLNNEYLGSDGLRHAIPPTLLISASGLIEDVTLAVTMDLKAPGNALYLLGDAVPTLGGSHLGLLGLAGTLTIEGQPVPGFAPSAPALYRALHAAMQAGLVRACHDLSEGGLAVAAAEMCIGGRAGLTLKFDDDAEAVTALFGESNGRLLVEVRSADCAAFEAQFAGLPARRIGTVSDDNTLSITAGGQHLSLPVEDLVTAWTGAA